MVVKLLELRRALDVLPYPAIDCVLRVARERFPQRIDTRTRLLLGFGKPCLAAVLFRARDLDRVGVQRSLDDLAHRALRCSKRLLCARAEPSADHVPACIFLIVGHLDAGRGADLLPQELLVHFGGHPRRAERDGDLLPGQRLRLHLLERCDVALVANRVEFRCRARDVELLDNIAGQIARARLPRLTVRVLVDLVPERDNRFCR